ncbi:hypothetical protein GQ457_14G002690 [Hibiscus cannabinus]
MLELADMVFILGYRCPVKLYWKKAEDNLTRESIRQLNTDQDVLSLVDNMPRNHYLNVYVVEESIKYGPDLVQNDLNDKPEVGLGSGQDDLNDQPEVGLGLGQDDLNDEPEIDSNESDSVFVESDNDVGEEETCTENVANEVDKEYCGIGLSDLGIGFRVGSDSESQNSESLNSVHESNSDGQKFPEFNSFADMIKPRFEIGLVFAGKKILKEAISQYGRINKYNVKFKKNDKRRLVTACKPGCPWILRASPKNPSDPLDTSWQIKTYVPEHICVRDLKNKHVTSKWIATEYFHKFLVDFNYPPTYLVKDVYKDHSDVVSLTKCQRARDYALEKIMGSQKQQYVKIYDYLSELRQANRGTTTICYLNECLFQRMYVCMQSCKDGFKAGCRPIISLDGCHLKGYYGGHILATVGIDADDWIYPIAYACVESECGQSWAWFLDILKDDLDIVNSYHISFMSDRQKGLVDAIAELFPHSEHRTCVRHLYTNFKSEDFNKGKHLKDLFWKAARSTIVSDFKDTLEEIKSVSSKSYDWLVKTNPEQWCKAFFTSATKSDMLLNNLCECFNKFILEARDKPILTMMETIRTKIMQRIAKKQSQAEKFVGPLCPKIQKKLEIMIELSNRCWPINAGGQQYQVECGYGNQHVVNMQALTCTCRRWELTGIPCNHAVSVMILTEVRPESHVHECYTKTTQERIYSNFINPIRGPNQWTPQEGLLRY